mmetsp:Transcript_38687/g.66886  ORF Transcript_38687/g.66886 Transcript_38687/m.66886 type:complete len:386 (-) Transcript_38687:1797-2954(-)
MSHVRHHNLQTVLFHQLVHEIGTLGVGCHLRLQITDVVLQIAGTEVALQLARSLQQLRHTSFLEDAVPHQLERDDSCAFLHQSLGERRHGARSDAANIGVVTTRSHEEHDLAVVEDRRDNSDIRQVTASRELRMIRHQHITFFQIVTPVLDLIPDGLRHGSQMHWQVRGIGHKPAAGIEQRAGEIQALFDVHADRGALQRAAHLLGNAHEAVTEHTEVDRIHLGAETEVIPALHGDRDVAAGRDVRAAAGLHNHRSHVLHDDGRTGHHLPGHQLVHEKHRRGVQRLVEKGLHLLVRHGGGHRRSGQCSTGVLVNQCLGLAHRTHTNVIHEDLTVQQLKTKLTAVTVDELLFIGAVQSRGDAGIDAGHTGGVGTVVAAVEVAGHFD